MSEKSLRAKAIPVLRLRVRVVRPYGDQWGRPGVGNRARLTRNEATGCTMPSAWELKMEIPFEKGAKSMSRKTGLVLAFSSVVALSLFGNLAAFGQQNPAKKTRRPIVVGSSFFTSLNIKAKHMAFNKLSASTNAATQKQDPRIVSLPNFTRSFNFGGQNFPYTMDGQDPTRRKSTTVPTQYIPLSFFFDEFVDQNGNNIVIDTTTITNEVIQSPYIRGIPVRQRIYAV